MTNTWADNVQAARHWPDSTTLDPVRLAELLDAATIDPVRLAELLEAATDACRAYALPDGTPDPSPVPARYTIAAVYQAREVYAASVRDGDLIGAGELAFRSRPLTASVKQLLRPETRGGVG